MSSFLRHMVMHLIDFVCGLPKVLGTVKEDNKMLIWKNTSYWMTQDDSGIKLQNQYFIEIMHTNNNK